MAKFIKLILINIFVLSVLLLFIAIVGYFYSKNQINSFFNLESENHKTYLQKDSLALFIHKPSIKIYENWGTKNQKLTNKQRTNNLGFREDENTFAKKNNEYRILVTGDSHTDGSVKENDSTFINVLEEKLNNNCNSTYFNCLNGGTAYYTFRNYYGFLKKYLYLKPDVFIINIFVGNDFRETLLFEDNRTNLPNIYRYACNKIARKFSKRPAHNQGVEQSLYFSYFNKDVSASLEISKKYLRAIKKICAENNITLIVTLLPSKIEVRDNYKKKIQTTFNLSEEKINVNKKLTINLKKWLTTEDIAHYDLLPILKQQKEKLYWDHDYHINGKAHKVIGNYLYNTLQNSNYLNVYCR